MNDVLKTIEIGQTIGELKQKITHLQSELNQISNHGEPMPELINSANLLRQNEHLLKINKKNTELLFTYKQYSEELEKMISSVFEIQNELKEVLKSQSALIKTSRTKTKPKVKTKSKPKTKPKIKPKTKPKTRRKRK